MDETSTKVSRVSRGRDTRWRELAQKEDGGDRGALIEIQGGNRDGITGTFARGCLHATGEEQIRVSI